ncbi:MAG: cell division protein FtsZ [Candidatus Ryanbacteria bacterium RIFCSPHIGHO2_02_FULL_45_43]|uniref:Cell division protein FtsZ n=1 Tax=Candidatus Ryanbacteria bacterium RIFCSPHIGHO2_01_45_13 TaxID=1802112 RepID=A0A1G2FYH2_9BACT|nr:MAG: cell division protein FtsZ [Candidatus Ryanbacteria bacterium RIFCSPHIGHO2_01_FULL_44_130]OGZ43115.1 MAG: cell division protein FtsZ [Candidatus Ryanbacteria bacterium RIFCSPHIGHO2_01_45_13]OGZ47810.1 MAG: cell division protein FtsZ [Candidatus Ryanbacteria bacterium RIFCSPHIGHO2_02_FULL_45_43]OGZ49703.1 MAG: cell division protein FtsZ [Candidatus Ryanbacteria bacterium RIFCSPHIGHO2_12_FULL_44_20]OGZ52196.1 MAG: cell division protein FtsZ [Candidatus Ryanbacteria bacterium RIFCSPLOWO2_0
MPHIKPDIESFARIKVVGVGGSGTNTVDHMIRSKVRGVEFIAVNTDAQDLHNALAKRKVFIGKNITKGLGSGMNPELGREAAEESRAELTESLKGADMVFIACGFGGGTGTGAAPIIANIVKETGALAVAVVTKPFSFEGSERARIAEEGLMQLVGAVDAMIVIPNDRLFEIIEKQTLFLEAFAMCNEVLRQAVEGISDLITVPGIINVDFADVRAIMQNAGSALMGIGSASGERRAVEAAERAIRSPLLDMSINGAQGVLFSIAGGPDLTMWEINEAARIITGPVSKDAKVIFGAMRDEKLRKGEIKVTVIATGFSGVTSESAVAGSSINLFSGSTLPTPKTYTTKQMNHEKTDEKREEGEWDAVPAFLRRKK